MASERRFLNGLGFRRKPKEPESYSRFAATVLPAMSLRYLRPVRWIRFVYRTGLCSFNEACFFELLANPLGQLVQLRE